LHPVLWQESAILFQQLNVRFLPTENIRRSDLDGHLARAP